MHYASSKPNLRVSLSRMSTSRSSPVEQSPLMRPQILPHFPRDHDCVALTWPWPYPSASASDQKTTLRRQKRGALNVTKLYAEIYRLNATYCQSEVSRLRKFCCPKKRPPRPFRLYSTCFRRRLLHGRPFSGLTQQRLTPAHSRSCLRYLIINRPIVVNTDELTGPTGESQVALPGVTLS